MLTIIIPTMNRSDFLFRQLQYYADTKYKHWILIGDSSDARHVEITKKTIRQFKGKLKIIYHELPGLNDAECVRHLVPLISTPYAVFTADDDFLVPSGLEKCIQFLEKDNSYIAAHGIGVCFKLQDAGPYGKFVGCTPYKLPEAEPETASQRLLDHFNNYAVTLFCVHRVKEWRGMYPTDGAIKDKRFESELLPCCLSIIQGKVKQLDCFYLVRQDHNRRYLLPNVKNWVENPNWQSSYEIFRNRLARELVKQDGIMLNEATDVVQKAFQIYLNHFNNPYITIQVMLSRIPGLRYILGSVKYFWASHSGDYPLSSLRNPQSVYHNDFLPVYRLVTKQPGTPDK
jgi:glycosyltransferase domain-containing protein